MKREKEVGTVEVRLQYSKRLAPTEGRIFSGKDEWLVQAIFP